MDIVVEVHCLQLKVEHGRQRGGAELLLACLFGSIRENFWALGSHLSSHEHPFIG